jgi:signal transduction histidine kinase
LTRAVHDIRVPLMAVHGYCGLLLAGQLGPVSTEQARILERMKSSLTRLGGLAESMMELGVGGDLSTKVHLQNAKLEPCINQAVHEILYLAEQKQIALNLDLEPPTGILLFDPGKLEQVLVNLLDNGCKFTPRNGAIDIHGYSVDHRFAEEMPSGGYRIDIRDTGPGIPAERIRTVFDEFTSYGGSSDRSGAGLGLAICRMIVNSHNGRIWATSGQYGATFSLVLPYEVNYSDRQLKHELMKASID